MPLLPSPPVRFPAGRTELLAWLRLSPDWTPLHHHEVISADRARTLLRGGANLLSGSPSPLELAQRTTGEASTLVQRAGRWSEGSHQLFPGEARAYAAELLRIGYLLAWSPRYQAVAASLMDAWRHYVMPHAVTAARRDASG